MKRVWFVRHAEPNTENHVDSQRELTPKGLEDAKLVTGFFASRPIDLLLCSPYRRSKETIAGLAEIHGLPIQVVDDFRERKVGEGWIENFAAFAQKQWEDFSYHLPGGECLAEVQARNIHALREAFRQYPECRNLVVGSHGTALSTVIHCYQTSFGYQDFMRLAKMPWIVEFHFEEEACRRIISYDLFAGACEDIL